MRNKLLVLSRFAHDPQGVLAAVRQNALMSIKLCLNIGTMELGVAPFTHADGRRASLYNPQFALLHDCSLAHRAGRA
jgi:hypothetical protein